VLLDVLILYRPLHWGSSLSDLALNACKSHVMPVKFLHAAFASLTLIKKKHFFHLTHFLERRTHVFATINHFSVYCTVSHRRSFATQLSIYTCANRKLWCQASWKKKNMKTHSDPFRKTGHVFCVVQDQHSFSSLFPHGSLFSAFLLFERKNCNSYVSFKSVQLVGVWSLNFGKLMLRFIYIYIYIYSL